MDTVEQLLARAIELHQAGKLDEADSYYEQLLDHEPEHAHAIHLRGVIANQQGDTSRALELINRAIAYLPGIADFHNNLGVIQRVLDDDRVAESTFRRAIELNGACVDAHSNLGALLADAGQRDEALAELDAALSIVPDHVDALYNRANTYRSQGRLSEAIEDYRRALRGAPGHPDLHWNYALALLMDGEWAEGWKEYEWRWDQTLFDLKRPPVTGKEWEGQPLEQKTLLVVCEQGFGDTIQFIRFAATLDGLGARVIVQAPARLQRLLTTASGVDAVVVASEGRPDFDYYVPLLSVPRILGMGLEELPAPRAYLNAEPLLVEHWLSRMAGCEGPMIGINWQGDPTYVHDGDRSFPLTLFEPMLGASSMTFVSLQKGFGEDQLNDLPQALRPLAIGSELDTRSDGFVDTAAVLKSLDLLITSDTAVAHLAGALGVSVWLVVAACPDWRWMLAGSDSPWYPTMRIFRQKSAGEWGEVFRRLEQALAERFQ